MLFQRVKDKGKRSLREIKERKREWKKEREKEKVGERESGTERGIESERARQIHRDREIEKKRERARQILQKERDRTRRYKFLT